MKRLLLLLCLVSIGQSARAGDCAVRVFRTAEPGKESEALAPFGGKNPTATMVPISSVDGCKALALKMCPLKGNDAVKSKEVKAMFDGSSLDDGKDLCPSATAQK